MVFILIMFKINTVGLFVFKAVLNSTTYCSSAEMMILIGEDLAQICAVNSGHSLVNILKIGKPLCKENTVYCLFKLKRKSPIQSCCCSFKCLLLPLIPAKLNKQREKTLTEIQDHKRPLWLEDLSLCGQCIYLPTKLQFTHQWCVHGWLLIVSGTTEVPLLFLRCRAPRGG